MSVAKIVELSAESPEGFEHAVREGITRASKTLENIESVWVKEQTVVVKNNRPAVFRVALKVTFVLKE